MIAYALTLLFATGASDASPPPCVLTGKLAVTTPEGKPVSELHAVVYVKRLPRKLWPHKPQTVTVTQSNRKFRETLLVLVQHDSVRFVNEDKFEHSVFANDDLNGFDLPRSSKGETGTATFEEVGSVQVQCDIHAEMRTDVLVVQNPVYQVVAPDGAWSLGPLPAGDYELVAWEPNGAKVELPQLHCDSKLEVAMPKLTQAKQKQTFHKNGTPYSPGTYH